MTRREMTPKQRERQGHRDYGSGRYAEVNPCYFCERGVGVDYYSTKWTDQSFIDVDGADRNFADVGLVLHEDCSNLLDALDIRLAYEAALLPLEERRKLLTALRRAKPRA